MRKNITMKRILTSKAYALIVCTLIAAAFGVGSAMAATTEPKEAKLTELMSKDLRDLPGKEGLMLVIEYPPGSSHPMHPQLFPCSTHVRAGSLAFKVSCGTRAPRRPCRSFRSASK